nr:IS3 family transposase [Planococcus salinarum]
MSKRYEAVSLMRRDYPVELVCKALGVSASGYYAHIKRPAKTMTERDEKDVKAIQQVYDKSGGTYGVKHISGELKVSGHVINHKRVRRLMGEMNIKSKIRTVKSTHVQKEKSAGYIYPNLLNRDFNAEIANRKWVTDLSELTVKEVKFFISAIIDLHNREVVGFAVSTHPNADLVEVTVRQAMKARGLTDLKQVVLHSDQGSVYSSFRHHRLAEELEFIPSMSRKANCWDNAVIESFFSHLKTEFPHLFPIDSAGQVIDDLPKFIAYFNGERSQKRLDYLTPAAYLNVKKLAS